MRIALLATLVCLAAAMPKVQQIQNLSHPSRIPGEFLIVLRRPAVQNLNVQYARSVVEKIKAVSSKINIVATFAKLITPILHIRTADENVLNQLFQLNEIEGIESNVAQNMIQQCSSQNSNSRLWGLSRVSAVDLPNDYSSATFSYSSGDGSGVRVYVLDTGIRLSHQDFGGRAEFGFTAYGDDGGDRQGHGTHCAGTVGGTDFGVAKAATLVSVKVLADSGFGSFANIISGVEYAVADAAAKNVPGVISMSLGGGASNALDAAVNSANDAGVTVVVAAGNNNGNSCNYSPGRAERVINVGNSDITDTLWGTSNWGTCVDIVAPGTNILSASHLSDSGSVSFTGTSMACPHVAGLAARYLSQNPSASPADVKAYIYGSASTGKIDMRGTSGTPNLLMYSSCA